MPIARLVLINGEVRFSGAIPGFKAVQTISGADPQYFTGFAFGTPQRSHIIVRKAARGFRIMLEAGDACPAIIGDHPVICQITRLERQNNLMQAAGAAHPKHRLRGILFLVDRKHPVVAEAVSVPRFILVIDELNVPRRIMCHDRQPAISSNPQAAVSVLQNGVDSVMEQGVSIIRVVHIAGKLLGAGIKPV